MKYQKNVSATIFLTTTRGRRRLFLGQYQVLVLSSGWPIWKCHMKQTLAGLAFSAALAFTGGHAVAENVCLPAPYAPDQGELSALADLLQTTLASYPSLAAALNQQAPTLCLDDGLVEEQAYFEPKTNRIVLHAGLNPDFQLAILIHEVRHLEQYGRGACPTIAAALSDYMRSRLALEADAAAIGIYVAWNLSAAGNPGPWASLQSWPTHDDLVARFETEITASGDEVAAIAATYAQWFEDLDRRQMYAFAICSNYLDALDREKMPPGKGTLPEDFAARLCVMPDSRPYPCILPP